MDQLTWSLGAVDAASHKQILTVICLLEHENDGSVDALGDAGFRRPLRGGSGGCRAVYGESVSNIVS